VGAVLAHGRRERITTKFSGLVGAYGSEEEATFLATQQVDEARHMQFYARFQDEVIADPAAIGDHVARSRERLSPAFAKVFDDALVQAHERLVRNPADPRAKVAFVTTYHLVIEATLGLTAFEFTTRNLEREGLLPDWDALGASADVIRAFALNGLDRRLKIIGVELA
jgi:ribonucleoside-diphosphate reductase beta chain